MPFFWPSLHVTHYRALQNYSHYVVWILNSPGDGGGVGIGVDDTGGDGVEAVCVFMKTFQ